MIKKICLLITLILFISCNFTGNILGQNKIERKQNFDYNWKFALGDFPAANNFEFDDSEWRNLDLPHDWSTEGKLDSKNPTGGAGGYFPAGVGWYRKKFIVPSSWQDKRISIYFDGVYMNSEVYINGKSLGVHPYGYTPFYYDITPYLEKNKENIVSVKVDNSKQMNCRWYSGSGIYRHVWLFVTEKIFIDNWGVAVTTPEINSEKAVVQVKSLVKNETSLPQQIILSTKILDNKTKLIKTEAVEVEVPAAGQKEVIQKLIVNDPKLWSPETPNLYQAQVEIKKSKKSIDKTINYFGIRSLKISSENGFQLNGKTVKINGGCVHHDNGCLGAAAYDRAEVRKVELIKSAGFNAVRTSHNPPSETFLDACDKLGLMVIDESFDGWKDSKTPYDYSLVFDDWCKRDVESMVLRDRNHPSIILWSIGNEIIERKKPKAVETAKMLADIIHKIDPDRPVTSAMTTWDNDWDIFDPLMSAHDVCGYNYQMHRALSDHERVPSRIIVHTESYPKDAFEMWDMVQNHNFIIGDFVWTAIDYLGESGIGRYYYPGETEGEHWQGDFYPWHGAYCGDVDLIGWRKPISHYRNLLWNNSEKLYMAVKEPNPDSGEIKLTLWSVWPTWESWTWPGYEGKDIQVEVYSKYPKVRLYHNNKLVGEQQTTKEQKFKSVFTIPYSPGIIKAVGVNDGNELESTFIKTAEAPAKLKLTADRNEILANGQDLSYVTIELTDKKGIINPNSENKLVFSISGPGVIAGVDNANLKDLEQYIGNTRKLWKGRALVVIKSTHNPGEIKLNVECQGLPRASVIIKAK